MLGCALTVLSYTGGRGWKGVGPVEFKCSRKGRLKIDRIKEQNGKREREDKEMRRKRWPPGTHSREGRSE